MSDLSSGFLLPRRLERQAAVCCRKLLFCICGRVRAVSRWYLHLLYARVFQRHLHASLHLYLRACISLTPASALACLDTADSLVLIFHRQILRRDWRQEFRRVSALPCGFLLPGRCERQAAVRCRTLLFRICGRVRTVSRWYLHLLYARVCQRHLHASLHLYLRACISLTPASAPACPSLALMEQALWPARSRLMPQLAGRIPLSASPVA